MISLARPQRAMRTILITAALGASLAPPSPAADPPRVNFTRDVRPILADKCFTCHGQDAAKRKGKLRLDVAATAYAAGASGERAIVPGNADESELIARIASSDPAQRMPPPQSGKTLTADEVAKLRLWVASGAKYERHWAFDPPVKSPLPQLDGAAESNHANHAIDAFVRARLAQEHLRPAPPADKTTLVRRLSLDLIGLPPTVEEVDAYLADTSPDAYQKVVDRLLASPRYGERWGRWWLDAARYADSDGFEKDKSRQVWFYRDWVVAAFNRDLPYNQFVIEQIAGDLLPGATQDQRVATGFLRNSMINEEGGVDPEQFRMEAMYDRIDAVGKAVLGLTIQCAQCHDHKYDPIKQADYYRLFAYLNNAHEANIVVYTPAAQRKRAEIARGIDAIEAELRASNPDWLDRMTSWEWERRARHPETRWTVVRPAVDDLSNGGSKYRPLADGSFLQEGYAPTKHRVKMTVKVDEPSIASFRLELMNDPNLPCGGPGRSIFGTAALTEFEVEAAPADNPAQVEKVKFRRATADYNPPERPLDAIYDDKSNRKRVIGPIGCAIDGKDETAWSTDAGPGRRNAPREAVFNAEKPVAHPHGTILTFYLKQDHGGWNSDDNQNHNLGRLRLSITRDPDAEADATPPAVRTLLAIPAVARTDAQLAVIFRHWRTTVPAWKEANDRVEALWKTHPEGSTQLVLEEREQPRATHRLQRGDFLRPLEVVEPGVPAFLNPLPAGAPANRLGLARWLVDRRSPTAARALVNRVWQAYFGVGLVATSEDLGTQAEPPSHPELLDRLAVDFMDNGWSLKSLHRLIVNSSTYRQSSRVDAALLARDPANRLLARGPRFRVDAEVVRDVALAASGLLNPELGGPSSMPPAPMFLFQPPTSYGPKVWNEATGAERYRRALYTFRYRSVPYPMLQAFDAPNGDFACVRRGRSNTPLQALTTLNEPIAMECARALAARAVAVPGDDRARLAYAFRRCVARPPNAPEAAALLDLLARQTKKFESNGAHPWELAADDPKKPPTLPPGVAPARLAAWTTVARVLLNLDETITKE